MQNKIITRRHWLQRHKLSSVREVKLRRGINIKYCTGTLASSHCQGVELYIVCIIMALHQTELIEKLDTVYLTSLAWGENQLQLCPQPTTIWLVLQFYLKCILGWCSIFILPTAPSGKWITHCIHYDGKLLYKIDRETRHWHSLLLNKHLWNQECKC